MTDTLTLVSEGERVVVGIELPKGKPDSPTRKVSFAVEGNQKYPPAGWIYADALGDITIGTLVSYRIEKNADGFNTITHLAPVAGKAAGPDAGAPPQGPAARDDVRRDSQPDRAAATGAAAVAEHDVPNTDTQRFEGWGFCANCGMVELASEELWDAEEAGALDKIPPELLVAVARHLLNAADQAQRQLMGRTDRSAHSHTRARGMLRTTLRKHPVRDGLDDLDAWAADVTKDVTRRLNLAASL